MREDLREKLRPMLKKYLEAEGVEISGTSFDCPRCGHIAWLQGGQFLALYPLRSQRRHRGLCSLPSPGDGRGRADPVSP